MNRILVNVSAHSDASQQYNVINGNLQTQKAASNFKRPCITVGMPLKAVPAHTYIISKTHVSISVKPSLHRRKTSIATQSFIAFYFQDLPLL